MDRPLFQLEQTVLDVLSNHPQTRLAFQALRTQCVGCRLARFCSLQDVAEAYEIPSQVILDELAKAVMETENYSRSEL